MHLVWFGGAWLVGVALGPGGWWWPLLFGGVTLLGFAALYPEWRRPLLYAALLLATVALGSWRAGLVHQDAADLPAGQIEAARGVVVDWPDEGNRTVRATIAVDEVRVDGRWRGAAARVWAAMPLYPALWRGDRVELAGYYRPRDEIPVAGLRDALRRRGLHGEFRAFTVRVVRAAGRDDVASRRVAVVGWVEEGLRRHVPQPEAALVTGILLGDAGLLPSALRDDFNATGTAHVMALSGWNIALVAGLCALLGRRLGRERAWYWLAGSAGVLWLYTFLVGGGPTIVRAAIMGTLYLLASAAGRRGDALPALVAAAVAMTALAPGTLLDIGFQLSCAATAGLILCSGRVARALHRLPPVLAEGVAATITAELFTLPLVLYHFGRLSTVTLPANLLIEPLVPLVMAGGAATVVAGGVAGPLGDLCGLATWLPARALLLVVERLGEAPWATVGAPAPSLAAVAALYALLGVALTARAWGPPLLPAGRRTLAQPRPGLAPLVCGFLSGVAAVVWVALLTGAHP